MGSGFLIIVNNSKVIRFIYDADAPVTTAAFDRELPFTRTLLHARVSGQEIWTDEAPRLDIKQENASVFTKPGEAVIGPVKPQRVWTSGCLGIYYGEGRGQDACNIFAKVHEEDMSLLKELGERVWKEGAQVLSFEKW